MAMHSAVAQVRGASPVLSLPASTLSADHISMQDDTSSFYTLPESLRESLYVTKGKRRYQDVNSEYRLPCDSVAARLELLTAQICSQALLGGRPLGLYFEPEPGQLEETFQRATEKGEQVRILDLGSGMTANWCVSMAERFQSAEVIGVDLIPSDLIYLPPNLTIEIHDLLEGLPFPDHFFDLIHCRDGGNSDFIATTQSDLIDEIARALKPGGIILLEFNTDYKHPFACHDPSNPLVELVIGRHRLRTDSAKLGQDERIRRATTTDLVDRVKGHEAFTDSMQTHPVELSLGVTAGEEAQAGAMGREALLYLWELMDAAAGHSETVIRELAKVDRVVLPEHDIGMCLKGDVIWAKKAEKA